MGQPGVQYHRINTPQGIKYNATSYPSLPRWNGPQGRKTHATFSENSDHQRIKMVCLLLPLDTIAQNPIFSVMTGNFKFQFKI